MERARPMTDDDFMLINGVGRKKMEEYGYRFIKEIISFSKQKRTRKTQKKGKTYKITGELYAEGKTPEEIAKERELSEITIMSHLLKLYDEGEDIDLNQFISKADLEAVKKAKKELGDPDKLKPYFEHFEEAIPYNDIKIALKIIENEA